MPAQITSHKCPACTGPLHYVGTSGMLECDFCGSTYQVADIESLYAEKENDAQQAYQQAQQAPQTEETQWDLSGLSEDWGEDGAKMRVYNCPSCGAELICDETTAATSCPYCDNPTVVPGQFGGTMKPDFVIPFKLDKQAAIAALKNHYKGKKFLPSSFTDKNHIEEIKGIYVPFWLFDGVADADVEFNATRSRRYRDGDEEVTETDHYVVRRAGSMSFEKIPVDASSKMPDEHMDSIEPFDYNDLTQFSTAYLPGFLADKYDVDVTMSAPRADERCKSSAIAALRSTVRGYDTVLHHSDRVRLERGEVKYALMPVWMLRTKWNGQEFLFAMNGQTGRLVGDLPVCRRKYWAWFAGIAAPLAALLAVLLFVL